LRRAAVLGVESAANGKVPVEDRGVGYGEEERKRGREEERKRGREEERKRGTQY
jgi:hypothetical protein